MTDSKPFNLQEMMKKEQDHLKKLRALKAAKLYPSARFIDKQIRDSEKRTKNLKQWIEDEHNNKSE
jgi:hypothetical protein